ncbi:UvrD-helicase domain-containing protein [Arthrobacter alpinus]|nr:UvrD-helicase domain-containing protein [Arthrobacter alpinus]
MSTQAEQAQKAEQAEQAEQAKQPEQAVRQLPADAQPDITQPGIAQKAQSTPANKSFQPLPRLVLVQPSQSVKTELVLSADQQAVVDLTPGTGPVLLWGAPGTGKSTVLIEAAVERMEHHGVDPGGALLLAPSRLAAAKLRDGFSARLTRSISTSPARTWSSYAFDLLRRATVAGRMPHLDGPPRLMSGPEQDLIIKDLLAGHKMGLGTDPQWPDELSEALETRGFRQEIRQLFDRVIEYGLLPEELAQLGIANRRPDWVAAASLYSEYRDVVDWGKSGSFDPAGIITAATTLLQLDAEFLAAERSRLELIVVDDIQEANRSVHELLQLVGRGKDILVAAAPDVVVQGFRGARPDMVASLAQSLGTEEFPLQQFVLSTSHRMSPAVAGRGRGWPRGFSRSVAGRRLANLCGRNRLAKVGWKQQPGTRRRTSGPMWWPQRSMNCAWWRSGSCTCSTLRSTAWIRSP